MLMIFAKKIIIKMSEKKPEQSICAYTLKFSRKKKTLKFYVRTTNFAENLLYVECKKRKGNVP
jgi:hypothetical protein